MNRTLTILLASALLAGVGCFKADVDIRDYREYYEPYLEADGSTAPEEGDTERGNPIVLADQPAPHQTPAEDQDEDDPLSPEQRMNIAKRHKEALGDMEAGAYDKAATHYAAIVKMDPADTVAWYNLACARSRLKQRRGALVALRTAVEKGYDDFTHMMRDEDLANIRRTRDFARIAAKARGGDLDPREETKEQRRRRVRQERIIAHFDQGEYDKARDLIRRQIRDEPENAIAWYNLACAQTRLKAYDEAIEALVKAVDLGYAGFRHLERDPDLEALRTHPSYAGVLARRDEAQKNRAERMLAALRKQYGESYLYDIDHEARLIFATDVDRKMLDELRSYLTAYAKAQREDLFDYGFEQYVAVVVPREWNYAMVGGWYMHATRTLTARSAGRG